MLRNLLESSLIGQFSVLLFLKPGLMRWVSGTTPNRRTFSVVVSGELHSINYAEEMDGVQQPRTEALRFSCRTTLRISLSLSQVDTGTGTGCVDSSFLV